MLSRKQESSITFELKHAGGVLDECISDLRAYTENHLASLSPEDRWLVCGTIGSIQFVTDSLQDILDDVNRPSRFQRFVQFFRK